MTCNGINNAAYNCSCKNVTNTTSNTWSYSCNCTYKNGTTTASKTNVAFASSSCACNNLTNCSCCYQTYSLTDSYCTAIDKVSFNSSVNNATNCAYTYEYYVAVVNQGKNSTVLLQLQAYQMSSAFYFRAMYLAGIFMVTFLLYWKFETQNQDLNY